jgi:hypothetical protein
LERIVNALQQSVREIESKMLLASRIWVSLIGILSILSVIPHWFRLEELVTQRGIQAIDLIGRANIRADVGGIFLAIGLLALIASYKCSTSWLAAAMIVPACALTGRFASIVLDGYEDRILQPIIIEIVVLALLGIAYLSWKKAPEGL